MRHSLNKISSRVIAIGLILMVAVVFTCPDPTWAAVKKPKKVTSLKVTKTTYNSVKLKWKKASRAKKYIVYRSLKKDSGYEKIAKVKKTSFNDKNLQTGQKYWYSVRAVGKKHKKGKKSKVVYIRRRSRIDVMMEKAKDAVMDAALGASIWVNDVLNGL